MRSGDVRNNSLRSGDVKNSRCSPRTEARAAAGGRDGTDGAHGIDGFTTDRRSGANAADPLGDDWIGGGVETSATSDRWIVNVEVVCAVIQP